VTNSPAGHSQLLCVIVEQEAQQQITSPPLMYHCQKLFMLYVKLKNGHLCLSGLRGQPTSVKACTDQPVRDCFQENKLHYVDLWRHVVDGCDLGITWCYLL